MASQRKPIVAALRTVAALAGLVAIVATFLDTASRSAINPFNFFGFFTTQSNIFTVFILLLAAFAGFAGRTLSPRWQLVRASVTTFIVIVGLVYNTLLAGLEGGISLAWANWVLHVALPIYVLLDWLLFADRAPQPWKRIGIVLTYPFVWIVVVLIRGATDGWVPYPFLNPALGYGVVALYCLVILVAIVVVAAGVWAISRLRVISV
jgi:FAR-17a/AIG1-like protein